MEWQPYELLLHIGFFLLFCSLTYTQAREKHIRIIAKEIAPELKYFNPQFKCYDLNINNIHSNITFKELLNFHAIVTLINNFKKMYVQFKIKPVTQASAYFYVAGL